MIEFRKGLGVSRLMSEKCCILDLSPLPVIFFGRDEPVLVNEKAHGLGCTILPGTRMCMMRLYLRDLHTAVPIWVIVRFPENKIHASALDLCINTAIEAILDITRTMPHGAVHRRRLTAFGTHLCLLCFALRSPCWCSHSRLHSI